MTHSQLDQLAINAIRTLSMDAGLVTLRPGDARGADVLADPPGGAPEVILTATGSEISRS